MSNKLEERMKISNIGLKDTYVYFDSATADEVDLQKGKLKFLIAKRNNNVPIENVIEMEINEFYFPRIAKPLTQPEYYFYRRVTMAIEEVKTTQTRQGTNNFRFHFEFDVLDAGIVVKLKAIDNKHKITKAIKDLTEMTFEFKAPTKEIELPREVLTGTITGILGLSEITFTEPHGLDATISHTVYFGPYNLPVAPLPSVVSPIITNPLGYIVTPANLVDPMKIIFAPTAVFGNLTDLGQQILVYVGERKIAFVMRFRSLIDKKTNSILAV